MKGTSQHTMTAFPPLAERPDFDADPDAVAAFPPEPSEKVAELLDVIDAAEISLEELLELTLCNIQELASIYGDAGDNSQDLDTVAFTTAAVTRLQVASNVLAELLPDDSEDEEEGEGLEEEGEAA
jgi:hypothetical protein